MLNNYKINSFIKEKDAKIIAPIDFANTKFGSKKTREEDLIEREQAGRLKDRRFYFKGNDTAFLQIKTPKQQKAATLLAKYLSPDQCQYLGRAVPGYKNVFDYLEKLGKKMKGCGEDE